MLSGNIINKNLPKRNETNIPFSKSKREKPDYGRYRFSFKELAEYIFLYTCIMCIISFLLYNSFYPLFILIPAEYFLLKETAGEKQRHRQKAISKEFCELISIIADNLNAGCSLEGSFSNAYEDMRKTSISEMMERELIIIIRGIQMNIPVEELLLDYGKRTSVSDILDFARVVSIAKKSGGNIVAIIRKTVDKLRRRVEVENEIAVLVAGKRMEQRIMIVMPFAIIAFLRMTNPSYINILYGNFVGAAVMTVCLVIICISYLWSKRIVNIEV